MESIRATRIQTCLNHFAIQDGKLGVLPNPKLDWEALGPHGNLELLKSLF